MLSPKIQEQIVDILESDSYLIENRTRFLISLNLPELDVATIINSKLNEFFGKALNVWNSTNGLNATVNKLCEILKSKNFQLAADELQSQFPDEFPSMSTPTNTDAEPNSFEFCPEVKNFTGRERELKQLQELFEGCQKHVVTITGMGGVGKTELAKRFAGKLQEKYKIPIIWLNAQNRETLEASINRLAEKIESKTVSENTIDKNKKDLFYESVSKIGQRKLVIIIDNVNEANEGADSLIKAKFPKTDCLFMITSRNIKVLNFVGEIIILDVFSDDDAHELVSTFLQNETYEDIKCLRIQLQNFPLALQQALAYIKEKRLLSSDGEAYKISKYVKTFEEVSKKKELLDYKLNDEHSYELTTLITWEMTMKKMQKVKDVGKIAMKILNSIAYFEPDRIHMDLLKHFIKKDDDIEEAIELIKTYSLIKSERNVVSIHRLLQQVIQINISDSDECLEVQHLKELAHSIVTLLPDGESENRRIPPKLSVDNDSSEDFHSNRLYYSIRSGVGHLLSVWNHSCKHPELITEFKRIPIKIIDVVYSLRRKLVRIDVTPFTEENWRRFKKIFGEKAIESLELGIEVAFASNPILNANKLEGIYASQISIIGDDNLLQLRLLEKIAYYIVSQGSAYYEPVFDKYLREYLKLGEKIMSPGQKSSVPVQLQLLERLRGKGPESTEEWAQLLEDAKILWGQQDQHTLTIMKQYGDSLFWNKKMVKVKEISELWLGFKGTREEETWEVTLVTWRLSLIQYFVGDRECALRTLQQTMVGWENRENHPKLFVEMRSECERADGKVSEGDLHHALRLYTRVNDYQKSPNYPFPFSLNWWRIETLQKRASVLIQLRRWTEAVQILLYEVRWHFFVYSDHKLQIERDELLKEAEEGLRLEPAGTFPI